MSKTVVEELAGRFSPLESADVMRVLGYGSNNKEYPEIEFNMYDICKMYKMDG
jgi:hypothetical protein